MVVHLVLLAGVVASANDRGAAYAAGQLVAGLLLLAIPTVTIVRWVRRRAERRQAGKRRTPTDPTDPTDWHPPSPP